MSEPVKPDQEKVIFKLRQELIQAVNALEAVTRTRTINGAKKRAEKTLRKLGYL